MSFEEIKDFTNDYWLKGLEVRDKLFSKLIEDEATKALGASIGKKLTDKEEDEDEK